MSKTDSLKKFGLLCRQVTAEPSLTVKGEMISGFIARYTGDLGLLLKLLLPKYSDRIYYTQEKQLLRVLSIVLAVPEQDLKNEWNRNGCIAETARKYFKSAVPLDRDGWCDMTLAQFDKFLDDMAAASTEVMRIGVVRAFMAEACSHAVYLFFREVKLDLRLGAGLRVVLRGLHQNAYEIFQHCANIPEVVRQVKEGGGNPQQAIGTLQGWVGSGSTATTSAVASLRAAIPVTTPAPVAVVAPTPAPASIHAVAAGVHRGAVAAQIKLGMPLAPMLAAPVKSVDQVLAKCPNGAFSEVKYDGERIQIHKQGDMLTFFARSMKPMRADKFAGLEPFLRRAIHVNECILDGEILMVDIKTSIPLPFGTLGKHKRAQFSTACPCVFLFDILYKDGASLLLMPLEKRRDELKKAVQFTRNRVMFSELCHVKGDLAQRRAILQQHLNRAIAGGLEGLVVKDVKSIYEPRARHWVKVKKDYLDGLADSADLLVLGAWYGSGSKGGQLSTYLMGCVDTTVPAGHPGRYKTVCKVGNGLDDTAIGVLCTKYMGRMVATTRGAAPEWLDCHSSHLPDMVMRDPTAADVMEIIGAEFSIAKTHTAGVSIRFPRILRVRTDKNVSTATTLQEVLQLFRASKESLVSAGVPTTLGLVDSYVVMPAVGDGGAAEDSNSMPPPPASPLTTHTTATSGVCGLSYTAGDATKPDVPSTENVVLCHCGAVGGAWSRRGFMGQVTRTFGSAAESAYTKGVATQALGDVVMTEVGSAERPGRVYVATMMAQAAAPRGQVPQVDGSALEVALRHCVAFAQQSNASLHVVRPPAETGVDWSAVDRLLLEAAGAGATSNGPRIVVYGVQPAKLARAAPEESADPAVTAPAAASAAVEHHKRERTPEDEEEAAPMKNTVAQRPRTEAQPQPPPTTVTLSDTSLPRSWWSLLHDVRAHLVGTESLSTIKYQIGMLGGRVLHTDPTYNPATITDDCTHVIFLEESVAHSPSCVPSGVLLVTGKWVSDCLALRTRYREELYHPSRLRVLGGCRLLLAATLSNRQEWARLATLLGAELHAAWRLVGLRTTHCIGDAWDEHTEKIFQLGGRVLSPQWLVDCAVAQAALAPRGYLLLRGTGTHKSAPQRVVNPIEGVLCGLKVCIFSSAEDGSTMGLLESAMAEAARQMGGEVVTCVNDAHYCVITSEAYAEKRETLCPALRVRCVAPEWLWVSARKRSLQDPAAFTHTYLAVTKAEAESNSKAQRNNCTVTDAEAAGDRDGADACSVSSYSTETFIDGENDLRCDADELDDPAPQCCADPSWVVR